MSQNSDLTLNLIQSEIRSDGKAHLYIAEISLLQTLRHFDDNLSLNIECLYAEKYSSKDEFFDHSILSDISNIQDLTHKLEQLPDYGIIDCVMKINQYIKLTCHDDGEVALTFDQNDEVCQKAIINIFSAKEVPQLTREEVLKFKGKYFALNDDYSIDNVFDSFEDYLNSHNYRMPNNAH